MSSPPIKREDDETPVPSSPTGGSLEETMSPEKNGDNGVKTEENGEQQQKKRKPADSGKAPAKKSSEEVLQRRREGRIKAAATIAQNLKKTGIGRFEDHNGFSLTSVKTVPLVNQKNYFAEYLKKDEQATLIRNWRNQKLASTAVKTGKKNDDDEEEDEDEENDNENDEEKTKMGHDTVVIHPGSSMLRVGRATDLTATAVPFVVGVKRRCDNSDNSGNSDNSEEEEESEAFNEAKATVTKDFRARMRYYKRRIMPNSRESAAGFNRKQTGETVADHSDPAPKEWLSEDDERLTNNDFIAGADALRIPISPTFRKWKLRFPIVRGVFNQNTSEYASPQELMGDLERVVLEALNQAGLPTRPRDLANMKCLLVIPDLYEKAYVETWVSLLLGNVAFGRVGIIQEAVAATFGSGSSCACVVDVGAHKTSIACVDEGMVIGDSRVRLDYGGDHVTLALTKLLRQQLFPCPLDLSSFNDDWQTAQSIKHQYTTFNDADIAVQLYDCYRRRPGHATEKYLFKVFDEVMLAPLGLFYPELFEIPPVPRTNTLVPLSTDHYTGERHDPYSRAQDNLLTQAVFANMADEKLLVKLADDRTAFKQTSVYTKTRQHVSVSEEEAMKPLVVPLDKAIIESITCAGIVTDFAKARKLYDNVLVVGGGLANTDAFDLLLNDRINIWRPKFLSTSTLDDVLNYVIKEKEKMDAKRKQLLDEAKANKKRPEENSDDVELTESEISAIDEQTRVSVDLDRADGLCDQGQLIPVNVLPLPKEYGPQELTWKGGCVYARLKVVNEMWITAADWELLLLRTLYYKSLFNY